MSFSVGIVGLPNAGKSTLFKALTKKSVEIASYPFTTISPNIGEVPVPDPRLKEIAKIVNPQKITPTTIKFIDIAGLVKEAHKGEGLGNQFLAQIRECNIILEVVRDFKNLKVEHIEKSIDPQRDIEIIKMELILKDLETTEKILEKLEKKVKSDNKEAKKKQEVLLRIKKTLSQGKKISEMNLKPEEESLIKEFRFLTQKPVIYLLNTDDKVLLNPNTLKLNLKLEEEISELSREEIKELGVKSNLDYLIRACYNVGDLITFFTIAGGKEVRAWSIKKNSSIIEAAKKVHSDFQEKFIKGEVISWQELVKISSWNKAKETGQLKIVGKDYKVKDGDVIEFKI
ncbi:MAG TPA: redox-regulated ATPase YchF [bacterium]|nr:redox-regulated ATPase YchF [bacterium]